MVARYQPVPPGYELFDGTNVNVIIDALNAQLTAAALPAYLQLSRHQDGFRSISGDSLNMMNAAVVALGKTSPLTSPLQLGQRMHTGDLLNKFAAQAGVT